MFVAAARSKVCCLVMGVADEMKWPFYFYFYPWWLMPARPDLAGGGASPADRASPDWCCTQLDAKVGSTVRPQCPCPARDRSWTWLQPLSPSCIFNSRSLSRNTPLRSHPIEPASYSITRYETHARTTGETAARSPLRLVHRPLRLPVRDPTRESETSSAAIHQSQDDNRSTPPLSWIPRCA